MKLTFRQTLGPVAKITDPEEAAAYFELLVCYAMVNYEKTREEAIEINKWNIGYWSGYYSDETMQQIQRVFGVVHPVFGSNVPTAEEAFEAGVKKGQKDEQRTTL